MKTGDEQTVRQEYPFDFSVVMAVYNVEPFLREAVDSLIEQDFGFEKIQLIMVDDGSTDGSGAICDEYAAQYPENVLVIHKENGGVSSARNEGLKYATGRYLNFMDSDDKLSADTMSEVYEFFIEHEDETDVVTIPMAFFDAVHGEHWQNGKFRQGNRVINLLRDYQATLMTMCASFVANRCKEDICFDSRLCVGEDAKVLLKILADKMRMGVVSECRYLYRRRSVGEASLIQSSKLKRAWYFEYMTYLIDWAVDYYQDKFGYLPAFLQHQLVCDLQWKFTENKEIGKVLSEQEIEEYKERLFRTMRQFDDRYVLDQRMIWEEEKCYILSKMHGVAPTISPGVDDALVHFQNTNVINLSQCYTKIEFIEVEEDHVLIEGYAKLLGVPDEQGVRPFVLLDDEEELPCEVYTRSEISKYCYGENIYPGVAFRCRVPLEKVGQECVLKFGCYVDGLRIIKANLRYGEFSPIAKKLKNGYYYKNHLVLTQRKAEICVTRCGRIGRIRREIALLRELWKGRGLGAKKAVAARLAYRVRKLFKRKPIWLISDRVAKADDNGEALFRYIQENHRGEMDVRFVLSKHSEDYGRLKKIGPVVDCLSWKHKMLFLLCDCNISAQADERVVDPFYGYSDWYRDLICKKRFVFLQHGVTKDDLSGWLHRFNKNISMFVTTTVPEYHSIMEYDYYYSENVVKLTGFPRYDRLYDQKDRVITIMPTWRAHLVTGIDPETGKRGLKPGFHESQYFAMYDKLLNSRRLFDAAEKLGYTVAFLNHPNMTSAADEMTSEGRLKLLEGETSYRDIFARSDLVVTDYSSVAFDFAYLRKPVVYYQADRDEFFSGAHTYEKGYFDYEKDGFGEVEYSAEALVDRIVEYMENDCKLKEKYQERIDATFPFSDKENCRRVYEAILEMEDKL